MDYKLIGAPCGQHGPYTFYKALKYTKDGKTNILALSEFFFVKLWTDSDLISIGELQLLWEDKNSDQTLASLRLYILPENTPDGRTDLHGEDEVLAITEKVVIRVEDLMTWITQATDWHWGLNAIWGKSSPSSITPPYTFAIDMEDIKKEKEALDSSLWETHVGVVVLSYPRYCRYRGVVKRLQGVEEDWIKTSMVLALGGFTCPWKNTRILFCKETFDYPELEGHELLCNHLAPKLKGRPRKRKRTNQSPTESETESESSQSTASSTTSKTKGSPSKAVASTSKPKLRCSPDVAKRPARGPTPEEKNFMTALQNFMKERKTPISRIPIVGFKEVSLFKLYKKVGELGGYDAVTAGKLWKYVYEVMGGDMTSTSAATLSRRHYEKLLLPYERHLNGTKIQPKSKSSLSHPAGSNPSSNQTNSGSKESKSSSLRNIRLKQEKGAGNGKENIPQQKVEVGGKSIKTEPEIINLSSNEPPTIKTESGKRVPIIPTSVPSALSPLMKKQKLDILKEGGLEVTPVGGGPGGSGAGGRASVIKVPMVPQPPRLPPPVGQPMSKYRDSKVSITVTPDMSTLLGPTALLAGPSSSSSKRPVYGNPKVFNPPPPSQSGEILDLRTKPRINIGSSLEITLVPSTRPPPSPVVQMRGPPIGLPPQQVRPSPLAKPPLPPSKPPPKPQAKPNPQVKTQPQVHPYPYYKPAYMPVLDHRQIGTNSFLSNQVYLSALYNNLYRPYSPQQMPQIATNVYKELLRRQGVFPSIDGSTSITLVSQTPTSK